MNEIIIVLAGLIFLLVVIQDNKKNKTNGMRLLKVEYSSSNKKNKKYRIRKYYLEETTGKIKIIDEHTNDKIIDKSNRD